MTIAIRPSGGVGWRELVEMICPTGEVKYFCKGDWTGFSTARPSGKSLGNPLSRSDANTKMSEAFACDGLNRLTSATVSATPTPRAKPSSAVARRADQRSVIRRYARRNGGLRLRLNPPYALSHICESIKCTVILDDTLRATRAANAN